MHVAAKLLIVPLEALHELLWRNDTCFLFGVLYLQAPTQQGGSADAS